MRENMGHHRRQHTEPGATPGTTGPHQNTGPHRSTGSGRRHGERRPHEKGTRRNIRTMVRFTNAEWTAIRAAAQQAGLIEGAWVAVTATRTAELAAAGTRPDWDQLHVALDTVRDLRRLLGNIGGNLNQLAATANTTGQMDTEARITAVLAAIGRCADEAMPRISRALWP